MSPREPPDLCVCACAHVCSYEYVCVYVWGPLCACVCEHTCVCACVCRYVYSVCLPVWLGACVCMRLCVYACVGVYICMMVVSRQREGGMLSFYAFFWFRVTSTAAKLMTSGVMLFLKYNSVLTITKLKGRKERKRRLIGLVEGKLLLLYSVNMKLSHQNGSELVWYSSKKRGLWRTSSMVRKPQWVASID